VTVPVALPNGALYVPPAAIPQLAALVAAGARALRSDGYEPSPQTTALTAALRDVTRLGVQAELLEAPQARPSSEPRGDALGVAEAAALLGVSNERARQLFAAGRLPARRDERGAWRALRADVIAYRHQRDRRSVT